jgi:hypothetical protein
MEKRQTNEDNSGNSVFQFVERLLRPWWCKVILGISVLAIMPSAYGHLTQLDNKQIQPKQFPQAPDRLETIYKMVGKWPTILFFSCGAVWFIGEGLWQLRKGKKKTDVNTLAHPPVSPPDSN